MAGQRQEPSLGLGQQPRRRDIIGSIDPLSIGLSFGYLVEDDWIAVDGVTELLSVICSR